MQGVTGGVVIDQDGDVTGMTFDLGFPNTAVLPSFIIRKWIEMEQEFRFVKCWCICCWSYIKT